MHFPFNLWTQTAKVATEGLQPSEKVANENKNDKGYEFQGNQNNQEFSRRGRSSVGNIQLYGDQSTDNILISKRTVKYGTADLTKVKLNIFTLGYCTVDSMKELPEFNLLYSAAYSSPNGTVSSFLICMLITIMMVIFDTLRETSAERTLLFIKYGILFPVIIASICFVRSKTYKRHSQFIGLSLYLLIAALLIDKLFVKWDVRTVCYR
jgi:hypothetical protein